MELSAIKQRQDYQRAQLAAGEFIRWVLPDDAFGPFEGRPTESPFSYCDGEISRRPSAH